MFKTKEILAAGIVRDIRFCSSYALQVYLYGLDQNGTTYQLLKEEKEENGSIIVRIVQQYNASPMIDFYEGD